MVEQALDHDMAALDQPHPFPRVGAQHLAGDLGHPRPGGIHQCAGADLPPVLQRYLPQPVYPAGGQAGGAGQNFRAKIGGRAGVEHHQARILHPAIRIFKRGGEIGPQRRAGRVRRQAQHLRRRQALAAAEMVIQKQPEPQQPGRAQALMVRQHKAQRPDDVRRDAPQHLALHQRLPHQPELVMLQIAQPAMDQLGGGRRGRAAQIGLVA